MNVFDFDGTIYDGDSETDFFFYCVKKYPKVRKHLFVCAAYGIAYELRIIKKEKFKQKFLSFVKYIEDIDGAIDEFWQTHRVKIKKWYMDMKDPTDVIISASPEFFLKSFCENELGVQCLMATITDKRTGLFDGENCHGKEKVRRFYEKYPNGKIDKFYSDRYCDTPLARLADEAYIVKGEKLSPWKKYKNK